MEAAKARKPGDRVRLSWSAREAYLNSPDAIRNMPAHDRRQKLAETKGVRRKMQGRCCTVVWFEDYWSQGSMYYWEPCGPANSHWRSVSVEYPPPADNSPMSKCFCRSCRKTGRMWPHGYVRTGKRAYECWVESQSPAMWSRLPGSISAVLREIDARRGYRAPEIED